MFNQAYHSIIKCNTYQANFAVLNEIRQRINQVTSFGINAGYAKELLVQIACLDDCAQFDDQKQDWSNCRMMTEVNKRTTELIIHAKRLSL